MPKYKVVVSIPFEFILDSKSVDEAFVNAESAVMQEIKDGVFPGLDDILFVRNSAELFEE